MKIYRQAVENVPILKYSWVLIASICILAFAGYFKLKNTDVFLYAIAVILISFIGFVFSLLTRVKDKFIKMLLYVLISCIVLVCSSAVLGLGSFIFWKKPEFYKRWFPDHSPKIPSKTLHLTQADSTGSIKLTIDPKTFDSLITEGSKKDSVQNSVLAKKTSGSQARNISRIVHNMTGDTTATIELVIDPEMFYKLVKNGFYAERREPESNDRTVVLYIDHIATDAEKMVQAWMDILKSFTSTDFKQDGKLSEYLWRKYQLHPMPNIPHFEELVEFQRVFEEGKLKMVNNPHLQQLISKGIDSIILIRRESVAFLSEVITNLGIEEMSKNEIKEDIVKLSKSIEALQKTAARLRALSNAIKIMYSE